MTSWLPPETFRLWISYFLHGITFNSNVPTKNLEQNRAQPQNLTDNTYFGTDRKCHRRHCHDEYFIILAVVSGLILATTLSVVIWLLEYRRSKKQRRSQKVFGPSAAALGPPAWRVFTSEELRSITKNFSEGNRLMGDAKTGGTYSGLFPDGTRV